MLTPMNRAGGLPADLELRMADDVYYGKRESILARSRHRGYSCLFLFRDAGVECPRPEMVPKGGLEPPRVSPPPPQAASTPKQRGILVFIE
jgi:hypothetical protein